MTHHAEDTHHGHSSAPSADTTHAVHHHSEIHPNHRVHMVSSEGAGHTSLLDKLSIRSSDAASNTESTSSAPAIVEKARKVKRKVKDKLHLGKHDENDHDDEYEDDDGSLQEEDDEVPLAAVRDRSRTSTSSSERDRTQAQRYAEQYRLPDEVEVSNSPRSSGLATPLGADHSDDDDENIIILQSGNKSAPNLLTHVNKGSVPGTPASLRGVKSPPGTRDAPSTSGSPARHRARSSVSLPASQSDWRRRAEFHNLFEGKVGEEEHLVSDYACAWVKDIFRQGRMYVGACNLAFICTIIGLKTSVVIPYDDIAKIEKSVTARVIPNALTVTTTQGDSYLFASFMYRDASYDLIMDCWHSKNPEAHSTFMATQEAHAEADNDAVRETDGEDEEGDKTVNKEPFSPETDKPATEHTAHPATECSGKHFSETVLDVRFPSEPEKIFKLLYQNPEFQEKVNSDMKLTDYAVVSGWDSTGPAGLAKREYSYIKPLGGSIGPSSAKCIIVDEELAKDTEKAFEVLSVTKTPDVPSGGSFSVHTKTCLTWAGGSKGGCRMLVTTECVWTGRSMVKGIITSSSIAGQREYNKDVARLIRKHIQSNPAEFGSHDTNAPEADDELSSPPEPEKDSATTGHDASSASGRPTGMFRSLVGTVQQSEGMATILLVSNITLILFVLISLLTSGLSGGKKVQIAKTVLSEEAEKLALQRLLRVEGSWKGFQQCVEKLVNDAT